MRRMPPELIELGESVEVTPRRDDRRVTQTRSYSLITPLLGGGVEPKQADPVKCISEKGVRGQLRFWWRAARGTGSLPEMKAREDALWGNASKPGQPLESKVLVVVTVTDGGRPDQPFERQGRDRERSRLDSSAHPYAAFVLQRTEKERHEDLNWLPRSVLVGVKFDLRISFPAGAREQVEAALWCWEVFGGVGGRTRRGFGALSLDKVVEHGEKDKTVEPTLWTVASAASFIKEKLAAVRVKGDWPAGVPHLPASPDMIVVTAGKYSGRSRINDPALNSWWHLIDRLQRFRQSPRDERKFSGKSDWPEPHAIRLLFPPDPRDNVSFESLNVPFPRATFGLPIEFKFKDEGRGDPPKTRLEGATHNRLASPLILRPLACADGAVGLALVLDAPREPPGGVHLKGFGRVRTELTRDEAKAIAPLRTPPPVEANVLKAFLKTL